MKAVIFDTETTGLPIWKIPSDSPEQPHIVSLAALLVDLDTKVIHSTLDVTIKPDGWKIDEDDPDGAFQVHGITNELANDIGIPEWTAIDMLMALCEGRKRVAYNATFDNRMIRIAAKRFRSEEIQEAWKAGEYECAMIASKKVMGGRNPKLIASYEHFMGKPMEGAHNALCDTMACKDVYFAIQALKII